MSWQRTHGLGALELAVLDRLWSAGPADVAAMQAAVGAPRALASNTIQSTLERLFRKGLAERHKVGRAFEYRAAITRAEWLTRALGDLLEATPGASGETAIAAFVDLAERAGEESLAALEARIRERRREREGRW
jgi:predicted transcriptional regulator